MKRQEKEQLMEAMVRAVEEQNGVILKSSFHPPFVQYEVGINIAEYKWDEKKELVVWSSDQARPCQWSLKYFLDRYPVRKEQEILKLT